ncbi:MAG: thioredoxin domain-containing protein [Thermoleophilaceae bacterium]|nr:thioredoxin domain-containing protein [Thermoleophilaceae bacterium]
MASRAEEKRRLRAEREEREAAAAAADRRRRRLILLIASAVAAVAVVGVLIAVSQGGGDDESGLGGGESIIGVKDVAQRFRGIPQEGARLGDPDAPATMLEFVDMQCPFCAEYTRDALPTVIDRYVRTGKINIELRPISIIGPDSSTAAAGAAAAAERNRMWQFVDLFYLNQGQENGGYVTDDFLRQIARGSGVPAATVISASQSPDSIPLLRQSAAEAQRDGINSTPSFLLRKDGELQGIAVSSFEPGEVTAALDEALAK